jgi:hypothetical protein
VFLGIEVELIWYDHDVVEYRFTSSNGSFCGQTKAYLSHGEISALAENLKGFPSKAGDSRSFELGTFDPKCAGGGLRLHFSCLDSVGHSAVDLELRSVSRDIKARVEQVALRIPVEAGSVDSFIAGIAAMGLNVGATAQLRMGPRSFSDH